MGISSLQQAHRSDQAEVRGTWLVRRVTWGILYNDGCGVTTGL